jgi:hypothetical protein
MDILDRDDISIRGYKTDNSFKLELVIHNKKGI